MIMLGLLRLARGDAKGIGEFGGTVDAFTASLAPLIAFPLVGAVLVAWSGDWKMALLGLFARLCAVLAVPLVIYEFARFLGRETLWLRAATAVNWSFWMALPALLVASIIGALASQAGLPLDVSEMGMLGLAGLYLLWYRWFTLRAGLGLNAWQAALAVLLSGVAASIFVVLPFALGLGADVKASIL